MAALSGLDLSKQNQAKLALAEVEKMVANDPKTLVQGEAIAALAKTNDKKYQSLYEKGITAVSNSVSGNSLAALATIAPDKVAAYADKIDLDNASDDLISTLLPVIVKNKIAKQLPAVAQATAFYPLLKCRILKRVKLLKKLIIGL